MAIHSLVRLADLARDCNIPDGIVDSIVASGDVPVVMNGVAGGEPYVRPEHVIAALAKRLGARNDEVASRNALPLVLTVAQCAEALQMSESAVYERLIGTGRLRSFTEGRCRRVLRSDLEAYLADVRG